MENSDSRNLGGMWSINKLVQKKKKKKKKKPKWWRK